MLMTSAVPFYMDHKPNFKFKNFVSDIVKSEQRVLGNTVQTRSLKRKVRVNNNHI